MSNTAGGSQISVITFEYELKLTGGNPWNTEELHIVSSVTCSSIDIPYPITPSNHHYTPIQSYCTEVPAVHH